MHYLFGDCVLDLHRHELRRADVVIPLEPKVYQVFVYLVQYRDRIVPREELLEQLWPGVYVDDSAVARCIRTIRRAIGDTPEAQHMIQTRRGYGYRFVAPVTEHPTRQPDAPVLPAVPMLLDTTTFPADTAPRLAPDHTVQTAPEAEITRGRVAAPGGYCAICQQPIPAGAQFCPACGTSLLSTAGGEHKLVTMLCGLVTLEPTLETRLGLDGLHDLFQNLITLVTRVLQPYGGRLQELHHDWLTVLFGAPEGQEDHAIRAVLAALALQQQWGQQLAAYEAEASTAMPLCLGLHTGLVIVQELQDDPLRAVSVVGDVPTLAAALARQAPLGTIMVSETTAQLVQEAVHLEAVPPIAVAGYAARLGAFRLHGQATRGRREQSGKRQQSRFVGREEELAMLHGGLEHTLAGRSQVVSIIGEPGMGKSRLLYEFWQSVQGQALTYLSADCRSYSHTTPYLPLLALVQQFCGLAEHDSVAVRMTKVRVCLQRLEIPSAVWEPELFALLRLVPAAEPRSDVPSQARKERIFQALQQFFGQCSQQQPLVLEVEDLHWIDATSEAFLAELVERLPGSRILLVVTARSGYRPPWLAMSHVTQIALPSLTPAASRSIVQSRLSHTPATVCEQVVARAQGNPFFLEELARMLLEQGEAALHGVVPTTVQAVLAARFDRLPTVAKSMLQLAAVIGKEIPVPLLQALASLPVAEIQQHLLHLQRAEFLYETRLTPTPVVTFKHALTQEVVYQSLLTRTRQHLHAQIARVLVSQFPESAVTTPELLAGHYTEAGDHEAAVEYWQQAGQRALERFAPAEAIIHLGKGLDVLKTLPPTPAHTQQELIGQLTLGAALTAAQGYTAAEAGQAYARAWVLSQQLHATAALTPALAGLWRYYAARGELQRARALGEEGLKLARGDDDAVLRLFTHMSLGITRFYLGEIAPALDHLEHSLRLYNPQILRPLSVFLPQDPAVACHAFAAQALWLLGYPEQALARCQTSLALAQELASPFTLAYARNLALVIHQLRREGHIAYTRAEEAMAYCAAQGLAPLLAMATILRGWALAAQGQAEAGIADMRRGLAANPAGSGLGRPPVLAQLAEAYWRTGQCAAGLGAVDEALAIMAQTDERWWAAEVYRLKGELILQQGQQNNSGQRAREAEEYLHQALTIARQQQAKAWELRSATSLSRLWQQQGRSQAARDLLAEVYEGFREGLATPDLQEARALLDTLC